ncbi:MAG: hypothetical protein EOO51_08140 [Flavobacterium sp.]|nr:MAG: hypothetical protein EOO51_08140 [Flavobacterium sp.]
MKKRFVIASLSLFSVLFYFLVSTGNTEAFVVHHDAGKHAIPENQKAGFNGFENHATVVQFASVSHVGSVSKTAGKSFFGSVLLFPAEIKPPQPSFSQQLAYSTDVLYRLKLIDRLFPFHSFW